eukprot:TRINITY_DN86_c0_g1_i1.p2 TRINITY_DN86_c0_g1~~TRINITY_DN86_c0_g1_i1.p2  ORF type:complete len:667 (-),score=95.16 TRINITY_DN86_c0_g1_i1:5113-7113(-)
MSESKPKSKPKSKKSDKSVSKKSDRSISKKSDKSVSKKSEKSASPKKKPSTPKKEISVSAEDASPREEKVTEPVVTNKASAVPEPANVPLHPQLSPPEPRKDSWSALCSLHNQPFKFFCEACDEVICEVCQTMGPHCGELHRVIGIPEAYAERLGHITSNLYTHLLRKRDLLLEQVQRVDYRIREIKATSKNMEKTIKTEYIGTLDRLKSAEGDKQAILQHDIHVLQKDLERIDLILGIIDEYTQGEARNDYAGFLTKFKETMDYLEYALNKPLKTQVEIVPHDLPRELTHKRKLIEKASQAELLLKLRDGIIWDLMQETKKGKSKSKENFFNAYELELSQHELVCAYCGVGLDEFTVNSACLRNTPDVEGEERFTVEKPPRDIKWTEKHFFGKPLRVEQDFLKQIISNSKAKLGLEEIRNVGGKAVTEIIRKIQEADKEDAGYISKDQMVGILKAVVKSDSEKNLKKLVGKLVPKSSVSKSVHYKGFIRYLEMIGLTENDMNDNNITKRKAKEEVKEGSKKEEIVHKANKTAGSSVLYASAPVFPPTQIIDSPPKKKPGTSSLQPLTIESEEEKMEGVLKSIKGKGITLDELKSKFRKYDTNEKGTVPLDVFYVVFMRLGVVLTNKEVELLAKQWDPEVAQKDEVQYETFLKRFFSKQHVSLYQI